MANYDNLIEKFQNKNFDEQLNFLFQIKQFFEENDKKFFEKNENIKSVVRISAWEDQKQEILNLLIDEIKIEDLKPEHLDLIYKHYKFEQHVLENFLLKSVKKYDETANNNALVGIQWLKNKHEDDRYYFYGIGYIKDMLKSGTIEFFHDDFLLKVEKILDKDFKRISDFLFEKKLTDRLSTHSTMLVDKIVPSLIHNYYKNNYDQDLLRKNSLALKNLLEKHSFLNSRNGNGEKEYFYFSLMRDLIEKRYYSSIFRTSFPALLENFLGNPLTLDGNSPKEQLFSMRIDLVDEFLKKIRTHDFASFMTQDLDFLQFLKDERDLFINLSKNKINSVEIQEDQTHSNFLYKVYKGIEILFNKLDELENRALSSMEDLGELKVIFNSKQENLKKQDFLKFLLPNILNKFNNCEISTIRPLIYTIFEASDEENKINLLDYTTKEIKDKVLNEDLIQKINNIFPDKKSFKDFTFKDFVDFSENNSKLSDFFIEVGKTYKEEYSTIIKVVLECWKKHIKDNEELTEKYSNHLNKINEFNQYLDVISFFYHSSQHKKELQEEEKNDLLKEDIEKETKELQKQFSKYKTTILKQLNNII